jgi:hypothetical protein
VMADQQFPGEGGLAGTVSDGYIGKTYFHNRGKYTGRSGNFKKI